MSAGAAQGSKPADRTVVVTRIFDAPAGIVFLALSRPGQVMRWFGPVGWHSRCAKWI